VRIVEYTLDTPEFGIVLLGRPLPVAGDSWGCLAPLRGTAWESLFPTVTGENLSNAIHGHAKPLMESIGPDPRSLMRLVPEPRLCADIKTCVMRAEKKCHPCKKVPDCYLAPGLDMDAQAAASVVVLAWREGRYIVIVEGDEFSL